MPEGNNSDAALHTHTHTVTSVRTNRQEVSRIEPHVNQIFC